MFTFILTVYSALSDLPEQFQLFLTVAQCHQDTHPSNWETKDVVRENLFYVCKLHTENKSYPALVVLYSTLRIGLQGSGFFPSFSCFPKEIFFSYINLTTPYHDDKLWNSLCNLQSRTFIQTYIEHVAVIEYALKYHKKIVKTVTSHEIFIYIYFIAFECCETQAIKNIILKVILQ